MECTTDVALGQVVKSKAGRDKNKLFIIFTIVDKDYVTIVDGRSRKLENPKKKKIKHLMIYKDIIDDLSHKKKSNEINNAYIRKVLDPFK